MRRLIWLIGGLVLFGCSDSSAPVATLEGTYDLKTVNGANLPYTTFETATQKDEVLGDVITASNGSFEQFTSNRVTINGRITNGTSPNSGTYVIDGTTVTFLSPGTPWSGTISGNTFTIEFTVPNGGSGLYVRR
jgi:hypothetical protein